MASRDIARARGFRGRLGVPLRSDSGVIGAINITRKEPGAFADKDKELLRTFADQAVIAIQNVELFEEVQARTRELQQSLQQQTATADVLKVISRSTFNLQKVLDTLTASVCRLCDAYDAVILLCEGDYLRIAAHYGEISVVDKWPISRDWVSGRCVVDRKPVYVHDLWAEEVEFPKAHAFARQTGHRTLFAVPLLRDQEVIGAINIRRTEVRPFTDKQIELVSTFADQAVIAIENVRLFEEVQQRTRELSKSLDDLRTAQDRLVQTEKLASLGQLTAGIAHEIKNPLNFVNNFSALSVELTDELNDILKQAEPAEKMRLEVGELTQMLKSNLEKVVQHGKRADSIVKNMLLHSREGTGEHRPVEINAFTDDSLNLAYHGARAEKSGFNVTLERDFDPAAGVADIYPQEVTRVLLNLISNGFYAVTQRAGTAGNGFEPRLKAVTRNLGDRVEVRIRDNGTGIPPDIQKKIFNPFFTTKPAGEGTGLGLSMSHDIVVKQHGGTIEVVTEPGSFTEFIITLPRVMPAQAEGGAEKMSTYILVVDDEPDVEQLFRQQFRRDIRSGRFVMEFATSAPEALERTKTIADPMLILILSDINMPGMSGLEMLPQVKAARPDVPVIMITAYGDEATRRKAAELGAAGLLTKPIDFGLLHQEIDQRLQRAA